MKRVLRFRDVTAPDESVDRSGVGRPICPLCGEPLMPGQVGLCLTQFEILYRRSTGEDTYEDMYMEDGSPEKTYHYECLAGVVPSWVIGAEPDGSLV